QGVVYLQRLAGSEGASLFDERTRSYAIYLLTRQGVVTTGYATSLERRVQKTYPDAWRQDLTGAFLAATYQLLRQDGHAGSLIGASRFDQKRAADYRFYDDGLTHDAMLLYLIARHFPERMGGLKAQAIDAIVTPIEHGSYNSLSSDYAIMALDAYVAAAGPVAGGRFTVTRSEEHTSELQSRFDLVCRLLLEKKKKKRTITHINATHNLICSALSSSIMYSSS